MNETQSVRMSAYNYAKHWGRKNGLFTPDRCDRALGYLMDDQCHNAWEKYNTTCSGRDWNCQCPDRQYRGNFCKHIIAMMIDRKMTQIRKENGR